MCERDRVEMEDEGIVLKTPKIKRVIVVRANPSLAKRENTPQESSFFRIQSMFKDPGRKIDTIKHTFRESSSEKTTKERGKKITYKYSRKKKFKQQSSKTSQKRMPRVTRVSSGMNNNSGIRKRTRQKCDQRQDIRITVLVLFLYQILTIIGGVKNVLTFVPFVASGLSLCTIFFFDETWERLRFVAFNCSYQIVIEGLMARTLHVDVYAIILEFFLLFVTVYRAKTIRK